MLSHFKLDFWTLVGIASQACFVIRFILQWYATEKKQAITVPLTFWYLSLTGSVLLFIYSVQRQDLVFLGASIFQGVLFSRNLLIARREHKLT